jgi:hypothetical protein
MIKGKEFAEKYFSQTEESEKLFSTGDSELDSLLEEVYYSGIEDGYDYAQKEFAYTQDDIDNLKRLKDSDIIAERKAKGLFTKGKRRYNKALNEAKYQAKRREKKDWKNNTVNRDGYSY